MHKKPNGHLSSPIRKPLLTISAIVPVYEEEKTVATVISTLLNSTLINEVICVNDGSTDKSLSILQTFGKRIRLINLKRNQGKGNALAVGIIKAKGQIVAFFDADLLNLSDEHISTLLAPLLSGEYRGVLGYPTGIPKKRLFSASIFYKLTGERAYFRRDLTTHVKDMARTGFGVEIYLNNLFHKQHIKSVRLKHLDLLYKHEKYSPKQAFKKMLKEVLEVTQEISKREGILPRDYDTIAALQKVRNIRKTNLVTFLNKPIYFKNISPRRFYDTVLDVLTSPVEFK